MGDGEPTVLVIGAGASGILAAIKLREAGFSCVQVLEKASSLGGTWRDNRYPGLACDVPSHLYCYSFAPNPDWSHRYSPGAEILAYLERTAREHGVEALIEYGREVTACRWDGQRWQVTLADGSARQADCVIAATGVLHHPHVPQLPGAERFEGAMFHSARWDESVPIDGRRVGVIGTGSTAVQLVAALSERVSALTLFQRTAQWVFPGRNKAYSEEERAHFREDAKALAELRRQLDEGFVRGLSDALVDADGEGMAAIEQACLQNLQERVRDPELRERLRPPYRAACKRLVVGEGFYEALERPNAALTTAGIETLEPEGVRTRDGVLHPLDVLVLATGFRAADFMRPMRLEGAGGVTLDDAWSDGPRAYRAVSMPGFPGFFMLLGPHSPLGNFSAIETAELQLGYVLKLLEHQRAHGLPALCARADATERFNRELDEGAAGTIWATGCRGWYHDERGRVAIWPFSIARFRQDMAQPDFADFEPVTAAPA